jgi:hypothetical protein
MAIKNKDPQISQIKLIEKKSNRPNPAAVAMLLDRFYEWQFEQEMKRTQAAAAAEGSGLTSVAIIEPPITEGGEK